MDRRALLSQAGQAIERGARDGTAARTLARLCAVGPRPVGGPEIARARQLTSGLLTGLGAADTHQEEVGVRAWSPGSTSLELLEPVRRSWPCIHCLFTAAADLTAPVISVGSGATECFTGPPWQPGSVALMDGSAIAGGKHTPLSVRAAAAARAGARGIILASTEETGLPAVEAVGLVSDALIPCVSVSRQAGSALAQSIAGRGGRVRVRVTGSTQPGVCANLLADLRPEARPPEVVIVGAHLDSFHDVVGAFDNLTGVATILEMARLLAPYMRSFRRSLRMVFYTGEETGFVGSQAYVGAHASELNSTAFVLNFDSLCAATARGTAVMLSPGMRRYIARAFDELACSVEVRDAFCMSSDYMAYLVQGIPAARPADFENAFPIWSHTALDDLAHVEPDWVVANAQVYAKLLAYLLTDPGPLPAQRLARDRVRQILEAEEATDSFRSFGFDV